MAARELVAERLGLDFPGRKLDDLGAALATAAGPRDHAAFVAGLRRRPSSSAAWRAFTHALTVRESYFFRDPAFFAGLRSAVLTPLIARRRESGERRLGIWSAACAGGEEAYSLAIVLSELVPDRADWRLTVLASDVDALALEDAARAAYGDWPLRATPERTRRSAFGRQADGRRTLNAELREMVGFAELNLVSDRYPGGLDLIVCRNVLMYFTADARNAVLKRLRMSLAPGGWLALSPVDATPDALAPLERVDVDGCSLYRRPQPQPAPARPAAAAPAPQPAAREPLTLARSEADHGHLDGALTLCREALRANPFEADAHLLLAAIERERGDVDAAIAALRGAVYAAPDSALAHFMLGALLLGRGATEPGRRSMTAAEALLQAAAPEDPVPGGDGITAGRLLCSARAGLEAAP